MGKTFIKILFFILISLIVLFINDYVDLGRFYFYFLLFYLIFDIFLNRKITLLNVWNAGFLFIILSEVFSPQFYTTNYSLSVLKYLIIANNLVFIGYFSKIKELKFNSIAHKNIQIHPSKIAPIILILFVLFYFVMRIESALQTFALGRNVVNSGIDDSFFLSSVLSSLGLVLPALIAYYFLIVRQTKTMIPLLISLPIFIILFMGGTRFPLLFSFLGFVIIAQVKIFRKMNFKKYLILITTVFLLFISSVMMKHFRSSTTKDADFSLFQNSHNKDLPSFFARNASPEGVIDMTGLMFNYFETNDFKFGISSSFLLYFWVPREVWPEKPTMLGYWLIRDYRTGFGSGHSASFGFTGELYADFGMFSLIFVFFIGRLLKIADSFKDWALKSNGYVTILAAMLFPYVFFFVRSPITATMNFLGILFFYFLIKRLIFVTQD